ncbi:MAG: hypothetical protein Q4F66_05050 [Clostridium sp.]|nr:hypothetical protein [Clostridium sp.]
MKRIWIKAASIILIMIAFIQVLLNNKLSKEQEKLQHEVQIEENQGIKYKDLSTLNNELNCLKRCEIIGASNDKSKWKVKVRVTGNKEDILNEMINFQKYEITSYNIRKNYEESFIILEMYGT